ncbi:uncharacterized protein LOC131248915 isoform X2 [Magnolia sinica]|uniref:uncharacterized protein LOC131248915 isoform X2 n=1 Tax=Magnolia sinica TaxID=86752 RepID=UPI00265AF578|nr:uncharacterized protein LOC131248915 isoform X2 [Magnolia sinica]
MNFLLRTAHSAAPDQPIIQELPSDTQLLPKPATTLEGLIAEDPFPKSGTEEDDDRDIDGVGVSNGSVAAPVAKNYVPIENHSDVTEDEGWITIPYKELPENWSDAEDIWSFCHLDRSFIFPGEQLHILACLSASKQDTEVITPFRIAAVLSKNGILGHNAKQPKEIVGSESKSIAERGDLNGMRQGPACQSVEDDGETLLATDKVDPKKDISVSESLLQMEDHKQQTESLLQRFKNSHFFVRIAESGEPLWSKRNAAESSLLNPEVVGEKFTASDAGKRQTSRMDSHLSAVIDRGHFDANASGGIARNTVRCCSLRNGDVVVLLQVNVGNNFMKDAVLEVLQFEKYESSNRASEKHENLVDSNYEDPCGELLKWLLPLDHTLPPPTRPLSPPTLSSSLGVGSTSHRYTAPSLSGSQLFSFGHFRSYSMSSLPPNNAPPTSVVASSPAKPTFELEDWDRFSSQKPVKSQEIGSEGLLSFRGVSLEPERYSVHCGLEGIYIPGKRWRRKLEIIQPVEIHSFAADCNTEDLLCVQIKNVSPSHIPDIVIFLDAITIVFEKAPKGGPPLSLPVACIEAGNDHSLPNLALRRGEEHSFILKPATSMSKDLKAHGESSLPTSSQAASATSNLHPITRVGEGKKVPTNADQYAVLVSCRCNYTESRLFFKKPTSWRPRLPRDLMISVASEISEQTFGPNGGISQLPVQVLTIQASNLTSEDLTLTVLAPASFTSPPSVVSLNSAPSTPASPFLGSSEFTARANGERRVTGMQKLSSMPLVQENQKEKGGNGGRSISLDEQTVSSDVIPSTDLGCTHLWLQSTVPLGCVPSQSTALVKLELLPLTDGVITLDTLQIAVKEKGLTYIPEHSLKIHAASSIATGIV